MWFAAPGARTKAVYLTDATGRGCLGNFNRCAELRLRAMSSLRIKASLREPHRPVAPQTETHGEGKDSSEPHAGADSLGLLCQPEKP